MQHFEASDDCRQQCIWPEFSYKYARLCFIVGSSLFGFTLKAFPWKLDTGWNMTQQPTPLIYTKSLPPDGSYSTRNHYDYCCCCFILKLLYLSIYFTGFFFRLGSVLRSVLCVYIKYYWALPCCSVYDEFTQIIFWTFRVHDHFSRSSLSAVLFCVVASLWERWKYHTEGNYISSELLNLINQT